MDEAKPRNDENKSVLRTYLGHPFSAATVACDEDVSLI